MLTLYPIITIASILLYAFSVVTASADNFRTADAIYLHAPYFALLLSLFAVTLFGGGSKRSVSLLWLALGIGCYAVGETVWFYLVYALHVPPSPSFADVLFLLVYPCFFFGMYWEYQLSQIRLSAAILRRPSFYVLLLAVALVGYFGIYQAYAADQSSVENLVAVAYGVGDLFLLARLGILLIILGEYGQGRIRIPWTWIGVGFVATLAGDLGLAFVGDSVYSSSINVKLLIDCSWMLGYFLMGYGMLQFGQIAQEAQAAARALVHPAGKRLPARRSGK